jgi:hypothetical protein
MSKIDLYGDTVLRKDGDGGELYLMNRQEGGWRQHARPVGTEEAFLDQYHVRLGEWSRDEYGEFCPVYCLSRSELPTLNDLPSGLRRALEVNPRRLAFGRALYEEGALAETKLDSVPPGLQQFIDSHPGVRFGFGPGPFLVALLPDGQAMMVDSDGTVVAED